MSKKMSRFLAAVLTIMMLVTMLPTNLVLAENIPSSQASNQVGFQFKQSEEPLEPSGTTGENVPGNTGGAPSAEDALKNAANAGVGSENQGGGGPAILNLGGTTVIGDSSNEAYPFIVVDADGNPVLGPNGGVMRMNGSGDQIEALPESQGGLLLAGGGEDEPLDQGEEMPEGEYVAFEYNGVTYYRYQLTEDGSFYTNWMGYVMVYDADQNAVGYIDETGAVVLYIDLIAPMVYDVPDQGTEYTVIKQWQNVVSGTAKPSVTFNMTFDLVKEIEGTENHQLMNDTITITGGYRDNSVTQTQPFPAAVQALFQEGWELVSYFINKEDVVDPAQYIRLEGGWTKEDPTSFPTAINTIKRNISVKKAFTDKDTHGNVTVEIWRKPVGSQGNGERYGSPITLTSPNYIYTGTALPMVSEDGKTLYEYYVKETGIVDEALADYKIEYSPMTTDASGTMSFAITNTKIDENKGQFVINKTWDGMNREDYEALHGLGTTTARPRYQIQGVGKPNTTTYTVTTPEGSDSVTYSGTDGTGIPIRDSDKALYSYRVSELNPGSFVPEYGTIEFVEETKTFSMTVNNISKTTSYTVVKEWVGGVPNDASATMILTRNGNSLEEGQYTITLPHNGAWTYTWDGLQRFDSEGKPYVYGVEELDCTPNEYTPHYVGNKIINIKDSVPTLIVDKVWEMGRPAEDTVELVLSKMDDNDGWEVVASWNVGAGGVLTRIFTSENANFIEAGATYKVEEVNNSGQTWHTSIVPGGAVTLGSAEGEDAVKYIIVTNSLGGPDSSRVIDIPVRKKWVYPGDATKAAAYASARTATFKLNRTPAWEAEAPTITVSGNAWDEWFTGYFTGLPKYDRQTGVEYYYSVEEVPLKNIFISTKEVNASDGVYEFINTLDTVTKRVIKAWDFPTNPSDPRWGDKQNFEPTDFIPTYITFKLWRFTVSGGVKSPLELIKEIRINANDDYFEKLGSGFSVSGLPKYSPDGLEYHYELTEVGTDTEGEEMLKEFIISQTGGDNDDDTLNFLNRYNPSGAFTMLSIEKHWENDPRGANLLPRELSYKVNDITTGVPIPVKGGEGSVYGEKLPIDGVFTMSGGPAQYIWNAVIQGLPRYAEGDSATLRKYEVVEVSVKLADGRVEYFDSVTQISDTYARTFYQYFDTVNQVVIYNKPLNEMGDSLSLSIRVYKDWKHGENPPEFWPTNGDVRFAIGDQEKAPTDTSGRWRKPLDSAVFERIEYSTTEQGGGVPLYESMTPPGYVPVFTQYLIPDYAHGEAWAVIQNVFTTDLVELQVVKNWDSRYPGVDVPDSIEVIVHSDAPGVVPIPLTITGGKADNQWESQIVSVLKHRLGTGELIHYWVEEAYLVYGGTKIKVDNALAGVFDVGGVGAANKVGDEDLEIYTLTITNTNQNTTGISGKKVWDDGLTNATRPSSVTLELHRFSEYSADEVIPVSGDVVLEWKQETDGKTWTWTYTGLDKYYYDPNNTELNGVAEEYTYYVVETPVTGYEGPKYVNVGTFANYEDGAYDGGTITNKLKKFDINGTKEWGSAGYITEQDTYPSVNITLKQRKSSTAPTGEVTIGTRTVAKGEIFNFAGLPSYWYDEKGEHAYEYLLYEETGTGYAPTYFGSYDWPGLKDGVPGWFTNQDGTSYVAAYTDLLVTNNMEKTDLTVIKRWFDKEGNETTDPSFIKEALNGGDEVTFTLTGTAGTTKVYEQTGLTLRASSWRTVVQNLPKYHNGTAIVYTVLETNAVNSNIEISYSAGTNLLDKERKLTITDSWKLFTVEIVKTWSKGNVDITDEEFLAKYIPSSVSVMLKRSSSYERVHEVPVYNPIVLTSSDVSAAGNVWTYTTKALPGVDSKGNPYTYTFEEIAINGKDATSGVASGYTRGEGVKTGSEAEGKIAYAITNTLNPTEVNGTKTWKLDSGNKYLTRPTAIQVTLTRKTTEPDALDPGYSETKVIAFTDSVIGSQLTDTAYAWKITGLPMTDIVTGKVWTYMVQEVVVKGYGDETAYATDDKALINSLIVTDLEVTKAWVDGAAYANYGDDVNAPWSLVALQLRRRVGDGSLIDELVDYPKPTPAAGKYTYSNLPKLYYPTTGDPIAYTYYVREIPIDGYDRAYTEKTVGSGTDDGKYGLETGGTVTNTRQVLNITVNKVWQNDDTDPSGRVPVTMTLTSVPNVFGANPPSIKLNADAADPGIALGTATTGLTHTFEGLPRYAWNDGKTAWQKVLYTITESPDPVPGYRGSSQVSTPGAGFDYTVTVTNALDGEDLELGKVWVDANINQDFAGIDEDDIRPAEIIYTLMRYIDVPGAAAAVAVPGYENRTLTTPDDITTDTIKGLPKTGKDTLGKAGAWKYYIVEASPIHGYENAVYGDAAVIDGTWAAGYKGLFVKNQRALTDIGGVKIWNDQGDLYSTRPKDADGNYQIELQVMRKEAGTDDDPIAYGNPVWVPLAQDLTKDPIGNTYTWSIHDLPQISGNNRAWIYTVTETPIESYSDAVITGQDQNIRITNDLRTKDIKFFKKWVDAGYEDYRPALVFVLKKGDTDITALYGDQPEGVAVSGEPGTYSYTYLKMPEDFKYTLTEQELLGYITDPENRTAIEDGTITNTLKPIDLDFIKAWDGDSESLDSRPVTGIEIDVKAWTATVDPLADFSFSIPLPAPTVRADFEADSWTWTVDDVPKYAKLKGLPKYYWNGEEFELIHYSIDENPVPVGYSKVSIAMVPTAISDEEDHYTWTATNELQDAGDIIGYKDWADLTINGKFVDNTAQDYVPENRPASITIQLMRYIIEDEDHRTAAEPVRDPRTVSASNGWAWEYTGLPASGKIGDVTGNYVYYVVEDPDARANGYNAPKYSGTDDAGNPTWSAANLGMDVQNELELTYIEGTKKWNDWGDAYGLRPDSITLQVWRSQTGAEGTYEKYGDPIEPDDYTVNQNDDTLYTWKIEDLPRYQPNPTGTEAVEWHYAVEEILDPKGDYELSDETDGNALVNGLKTKDVIFYKEWRDVGYEDVIRPNGITLTLGWNGDGDIDTLYKDANKGTELVGAQPDAVAEDAAVGKYNHLYSYTYRNLPENFDYTATEEAMLGYDTTVKGVGVGEEEKIGYEVGEGGTIFNAIKLINRDVIKLWMGDLGSLASRPKGILVYLRALAGGSVIDGFRFNSDITLLGEDAADEDVLDTDGETVIGKQWGWTVGSPDDYAKLKKLPMYKWYADAGFLPITYGITEEPISGYTTSVDFDDETLTFTITNEMSTTEVEGDKTWIEDITGGLSTLDENHPANITVQLMRYPKGYENDEESVGIPVSVPGHWEFTGLQKTCLIGEETVEFVYYVIEIPTMENNGYYAPLYNDVDENGNIVRTDDGEIAWGDTKGMNVLNELITIDISGTKDWTVDVEGDLQDGEYAPENTQITLDLYRSLVPITEEDIGGASVELYRTMSDVDVSDGTWSFGKVPKYAPGTSAPQLWHYLVVERPINGYTIKITTDIDEETGDYTVAITNELITVDFTVDKSWIEDDIEKYVTRPATSELTFELRRKTNTVDEPVTCVGVDGVFTMSSKDGVTWTFTTDLLPKYRLGYVPLEEYIYYAVEIEPKPDNGYTVGYDNYDELEGGGQGDGFALDKETITNQLKTVNIDVIKNWIGDEVNKTFRDNGITVTLMSNVPVTVGSDVDGDAPYLVAGPIALTKGNASSSPDSMVAVTDDDDIWYWQPDEFTNLPMYYWNGKEYELVVYTVVEQRVDGYFDADSAEAVPSKDNEAVYEVTLNNFFRTARDFIGIKLWGMLPHLNLPGKPQAAHPDEIYVQLWRKAAGTDGTPLVDEPVPANGMTTENPLRVVQGPRLPNTVDSWTFRFTGLVAEYQDGIDYEFYAIEVDASGNPIDVDNPITGYTTEYKIEGNRTIINMPELIDCTITKLWTGDYTDGDEINDEPDGLRVTLKSEPESVLGNGQSYTLLKGEGWTHTFTKLPKYTYVGGEAIQIQYYIEEQLLDADGFILDMSEHVDGKLYARELEGEADDLAATLSNEILTIDIQLDKEWLDGVDYRERREVTVQLWRKVEGKVDELVGEKVIAIDPNHPDDIKSVIFENLMKYYTELEGKGRNKELKWYAYTYYVKEAPIASHERIDELNGENVVSVDEWTEAEGGLNVTTLENKLITTDIHVTKYWDDWYNDEINYFNLRGTSLTFYLWRSDPTNGEGFKLYADVNGEVSRTITIPDEDDKEFDDTVYFRGLPVFADDDNTVKYEYKVTEGIGPNGEMTNVPPANYELIPGEPEESFDEDTNTHTFTFTNVLKTIEIELNKLWNDELLSNAQRLEYRPDIVTITLTVCDADGNPINGVPQTELTIVPSNRSDMLWQAKFEGLPKGSEDAPFTFRIKEEMAKDGQALYAYEDIYDLHRLNDSTYGLVVRREEDGKYVGSVKNMLMTVENAVRKNWIDEANRHGIRPTGLIVELLADRNRIGDAQSNGVTVVLTSGITGQEDRLSANFPTQPMYRPDVKKAADQADADENFKIVYGVEETPYTAYTLSESEPVFNQDKREWSYTLNNTLVTKNLILTKAWVGDAGFESFRPNFIEVTVVGTVTAGGTTTTAYSTTLRLFAATGWTAPLYNLPVYDAGGNVIVYSVQETMTNLMGYTSTHSSAVPIAMSEGNERSNMTSTITNTLVPVTVGVAKVWTNRSWTGAPNVTIQLYANGLKVSSSITETYNNATRSRTFTGLPRYDNRSGREIAYAAYETSRLPTDHYYVSTVTSTTTPGFLAYITVTNTYNTVGGEYTPPPTVGGETFRSEEIPLSSGIGDHLHLGDCFD